MAEKVDDTRIERAEPGIGHLQDVDIHDKNLNNEAHEANAREHDIGLLEAFKTYRRAAFWAIGTVPFLSIPSSH